MSIESMQSTYRAYQQAGGMDKYLKQDIDPEQKKRTLQLLLAWCNEVNQYYSITFSKNELLFQDLAARVFIFGKTTSKINLTTIRNQTGNKWIEACFLIKDITLKIFSYLKDLESIMLQKDHSQIAQFLDKHSLYSRT